MSEIWEKVEKTDAKYTKDVSFGRKFTSICAYSQIKRATEIFGAAGEGWGWDFEIIPDDNIWVFKVSLWHGKKENVVNSFGCCDKIFKKKPDDDAPKKALTDGITKALSYLGFNADVFLGQWDKNDNKYVQAPENPKAKPKRQYTDYQQNAVDKMRTFFKDKNAEIKKYLDGFVGKSSYDLSSDDCDCIINDINDKETK